MRQAEVAVDHVYHGNVGTGRDWLHSASRGKLTRVLRVKVRVSGSTSLLSAHSI